jgi:predicted Zn finger-like uncharacterized protein
MRPLTLRCPECDAPFGIDPQDAGASRARCPQCGAVFSVRSGSTRSRDDHPPRRRSSAWKWVIIIVVVFGVLGVGCCGGLAWLGWSTVQPTTFPEQTQDYADARKSFKTNLERKGPAPMAGIMGTRPTDAMEVQYPSGNLNLKAWISRTRSKSELMPAVLYLHGGFAFGEDDWRQCQRFRDAGFVTMTPTLRGENGQSGTYTLFYDEVNDVVAAAEFLSKMPGVDSDRIYVAGHSAGGTLAMLAAMTSKRFKGCASFSGSPDQVTFVKRNSELAPFNSSNSKELEMRSPLAFPKSFKCPARLYWGSEEMPFRLATRALIEKATAAGLDVQGIEVPGDHFSSLDQAIPQAVTFFQQQK